MSPTPRFAGSRLGPPMLVVSLPEIRSTEELDAPARFPTRDGMVHGRVGDFAVTAYGGERYPILRQVFFGAYEVLGRVGQEYIAQRLVHVRRAWTVLDDGAAFDYGTDRGMVPVERHSWLYQSDDSDFGTVHADVQGAGHIAVGTEHDFGAADWRARCALWNRLLHMLPPVLAFLALFAFMTRSIPSAPHWLADVLLAVEVVLLAGGAAIARTMRSQRWHLKSCVQTTLELGQEFQSASQLLGQPASTHFYGMAFWRAVQLPAALPDADADADTAPLMHALKAAMATRLAKLNENLKRTHVGEAAAAYLTLGAFIAVLAGNLSLLAGNHTYALGIEFAVCWLPALLASVHGFGLRRRTAERMTAMRSFADQLRFAQVRLFDEGAAADAARQAVLAVVCRAVARYCQHEFRIAIGTEAPLPL